MTVDYLINPLKQLRKSWLFILTLVAISSLFMLKFCDVKAQNISVSSAQNCDSNAVMFCGASSVNQLIDKFNHGDGHNSAMSIQHIYSFFGISSSNINSMSSSSVNVESGWVGKNGHVFNNHNALVATNALTGGRMDISGSSREDIGGTVFFVRPPSVSFQNDFLKAFVVSINNRFAFAIIASCGNAVKATPVTLVKSTPVTTPTPATPSPTPQVPQSSSTTINSNCSNVNSANSSNTTVTQGGNCNTSVQQVQNNNTTVTPTPVTPTATPTQTPPTPVATTSAAPTTLVNTGPGNLIAIFIAVSIISTVGHHLFISRIKPNQQT